MISQTILQKIQKIKMLACDLDGVLTDGRIWLDRDGAWRRAFCVQDGVGIKRLQEAGYPVAIITMSKSEDVKIRASYLGVDYFYDGVLEKQTPFQDLLEKTQMQADQVAYVGDDLMDVPVLKQCGLALSVPNAVDSVKQVADHITARSGGFGAVREICELLLTHHT